MGPDYTVFGYPSPSTVCPQLFIRGHWTMVRVKTDDCSIISLLLQEIQPKYKRALGDC